MSLMTDILVYCADKECVERLNAWLNEHDTERHQQLRPIDMEHAGGVKWWTFGVWAASFNYLPDGFRELLRDPETWKYSVFSTAVIIDGEDCMEAFCFDGSEDAGYARVVQQKP